MGFRELSRPLTRHQLLIRHVSDSLCGPSRRPSPLNAVFCHLEWCCFFSSIQVAVPSLLFLFLPWEEGESSTTQGDKRSPPTEERREGTITPHSNGRDRGKHHHPPTHSKPKPRPRPRHAPTPPVTTFFRFHKKDAYPGETTILPHVRDAKVKRPDVSLEHVRTHTGIVANGNVNIIANKGTTCCEWPRGVPLSLCPDGSQTPKPPETAVRHALVGGERLSD